MVGWHHRLNGHGFGWTPGVGDGQGGLECWGSWGCKESNTTKWLNWTEFYSAYQLALFATFWASQVAQLVKNPPANARDARDAGSIPGVGNGNPLQYPCMENSMDRGAWWGLQSMESQKVRHDWVHTGRLQFSGNLIPQSVVYAGSHSS